MQQVETELRRLEPLMTDPQVCGDTARLARVSGGHEHAQAEFEHLDGYRYENRVREVLHSLG